MNLDGSFGASEEVDDGKESEIDIGECSEPRSVVTSHCVLETSRVGAIIISGDVREPCEDDRKVGVDGSFRIVSSDEMTQSAISVPRLSGEDCESQAG